MRMRGKLITLEGDDGLGKTTQAALLAERLQAEGHDVVQTREPGATEVGRTIREIVLHHKGQLSKATEMLLYQADRAQHYKEILKPALKAGKVVVCDRFLHSTLVYQGAVRGWPIPLLWRLHNAATSMLLPDLTIVLDGIPLTEGDPEDRFEREGDEFHKKVRQAYRWQAQVSQSRCVVINANQEREILAAGIYHLVAELLLS